MVPFGGWEMPLSYAEGTIAFYERLRANHPNTGVCLQSYLRRTAADIQRLLPLDPSIRLVKGAYAESEAIAYQSRPEVDANYLALCVSMLAAKKSGTDLVARPVDSTIRFGCQATRTPAAVAN